MPEHVVSSTLQNPQRHNIPVLGSLEEVARPTETVDGTVLLDDTTDTFRTLELVEHEACSNGVVKTVHDVVH